MGDSIIDIKQIVKQSNTKYTQEEIENAIRGQILKFNKWIDELSKEHETELKQILDEAYNEAEKKLNKERNI